MTGTCPPGHTAYLSELLATNAATLHAIAHPRCRGYAPWPCGDHWHVGHTTPIIGNDCKADPMHRAVGRRLATVRETWSKPRPRRR